MKDMLRWLGLLLFAAVAVGGAVVAVIHLSPGDGAVPPTPAGADLKPFLESYFATWSDGDMDAWRSHFAPQAHIVNVKDGKVVYSGGRDGFVKAQTIMLARSNEARTERMTSFSAEEDASAATVTAGWLLERGDERIEGVDRFILMRDAAGEWKIVSLVFYTTPE